MLHMAGPLVRIRKLISGIIYPMPAFQESGVYIIPHLNKMELPECQPFPEFLPHYFSLLMAKI